MDTTLKQLSAEDIREIGKNDDLKIAPFRADGITFGTPTWIWNVVVDDKLYVRAYNGKKSRWYQSAMAQKAGKIEAVGENFKVSFSAEEDEALNRKIDDAYKTKYGNSPYLSSMIKVKEATVEVK